MLPMFRRPLWARRFPRLVLLLPLAVFIILPLLPARLLGQSLPESPRVFYYVDGACAVSGDGRADQCAGSSGGPGAFRDPQSCFAAVRAGDVCYIKNGTYLTNNNGADQPFFDGGFTVGASGTATAPITIRNYPGHTPLLANCSPAGTSYCGRATITAPRRSYLVFEGLRVHGGYSLYGPATGNVIRNSEITQGYGVAGDGNWAGIRSEEQTGILIQNNYLHDIYVLSGGGQQSSGSCIKFYQNTDALVEYNTCRSVRIPDSQAGGVDDKAAATRNVHRYNWIEDVPVCFRVNNQEPSTGNQIYGNVCIGGRRAGYGTSFGYSLLVDINGIDVYNNLFHNFESGMYTPAGTNVRNARHYNNIFSQLSPYNNLETYAAPFTVSNYNRYTAGQPYRYNNQVYSTLSSFRSATGLEAASAEGDCQFVNLGLDFHLQGASPCRNAGRVGGTAAGAAIDLGPYALTSCVGYGCGRTP